MPQLRFINDGDLPVLLLDGEELIGAKQNRILNLSVLAPAHKTIVIPVSCVEAGRWDAQSAEFAGARRAHFAAGRARKARDVSDSLRRHGTRESDQGRVWADIAAKSRRFGIHSATSAAAALYDGQRERLDDFQGAFAPQPHQCGALFALNGRVVGLDLFDSPATLAAALPKLVESHALDALDRADATAPATPADPGAWLHAIAQAATERFPAVGEGEDWRLHGPQVTGGALVKKGQLIHLCAFRLGAAGEEVPGDEADDFFGPEGGGWDEDEPAGAGDEAAAPSPAGTSRPEPLVTPAGIRLDLATDRRLIRAAGHSRRYLHLRLTAPRGRRERVPLDLALVLDRSGSMGGGKWQRAREAALAAMERLSARDRVALVAFDHQITTPLPLAPAIPAARQQAAAALAALRPRGQTNLGEAWLTACGLIGRNGGAERLRRCLVLTDGQANVGITAPATLADHAAHLLQLGVRTSTFGVGDDYHEELLGQLADAGGGACHDIAGAEGIQTALGRELGDALEVVYADVRVHLTWQADLQVRALGTWRTQPGPRSLTLLPGEAIDEIGLAERLSMSRTPIREALVRLAGDGLVLTLPNRSTVVAPIDFLNLHHFFRASVSNCDPPNPRRLDFDTVSELSLDLFSHQVNNFDTPSRQVSIGDNNQVGQGDVVFELLPDCSEVLDSVFLGGFRSIGCNETSQHLVQRQHIDIILLFQANHLTMPEFV